MRVNIHENEAGLVRQIFIVPALVLVLLTCLTAQGSEPTATFTKRPVATKTGDRVKIEFAVNRETDVSVFIEDSASKTIRHLVAGVLGKNPPAPLKPNSLDQSIEWDGKADWGKPAGAGPFKVRVALGLGAR